MKNLSKLWSRSRSCSTNRLRARSFVLEQLENRRLFAIADLPNMTPGILAAIANHGSEFGSNQSAKLRGNSAPASGVVTELESPNDTHRNNTPATAQFLPKLGTGKNDLASIDVTGSGGNAPADHVVTPHEDDGSIPLANSVGLVAGGTGRITASGTIGNGPNGSRGTRSGDYDFYKVPAHANQLLTIDVDIAGSTLDSVVAIYDSHGTMIASNDNEFNNIYYGVSLGSHLRFLTPKADIYSVVVYGSGLGPQANAFVSTSGPGVASEGSYRLTILKESPHVISSLEDDGSIPLANETGLSHAASGKVFATGVIGDGLHGSAGARTGDFDFYRVQANAGDRIVLDVDTPVELQGLDSTIEVFDSTGIYRYGNDDDSKTFDSALSFIASQSDTFYIAIGLFPLDPFDSSSGIGVFSEGPYNLSIELNPPTDVDYYSFDLAAGDIFGASISGSGHRLELYRPDGTLAIGSSQDRGSIVYPANSPLPVGGTAVLSYVIDTPGRYFLAAASSFGSYSLQLRDFRPVLESQPVYSHQILFLDFDGASVNVPLAIPYFPNTNPDAHLAPMSSYLLLWGLKQADESAVIDAIVSDVVYQLAANVSGVVGRGRNGDFTISGRAGDFQIEVLNSRDNADPFGLYPNVSRVIIGGDLAELQAPIFFGGVSSSIDVGNFDTAETAISLMDIISNDFHSFPIPIAPGKTVVDLMGLAIGNLVAHEAGHFFGNWHTKHALPSTNIMNPYFLFDIGKDGIFGNEDDAEFEFKFGRDIYEPLEGFAGTEDTLNTIAFGLSTGTKSGTYFDFVTGTLYVTGNIDDGHKDELEVKTVGSDLKVFINDKLVLTRPSAGVNRVFLNGSSDKDKLDASNYHGPVTLNGRGSNDELEGGSGNDLLFGGDGNDELDGGTGDDLLFGDEGNDELYGRAGNDLLIGGNGDDYLDGGSENDVLIGGLGQDQLFGGSGNDLLIGSSTRFDTNATALRAILAEWTSSRNYVERIANLRGTSSGPRDNQDYFLKVTGPQATVFDDSVEDNFTGGSGRDWYFARLTGSKKDKLNDLDNNEVVDLL